MDPSNAKVLEQLWYKQLTFLSRYFSFNPPVIPIPGRPPLHSDVAVMDVPSSHGDVKKEDFPTEDIKEELDESMGEANVPAGGGLADISDRKVATQKLLQLFDSHCDTCGGPVQWLQATFNTVEKEQKFKEYLLSQFPWLDCVEYADPFFLGKKEKSFVHITMLSYHPDRSTKGLPFRSVCRDLAEEFLTHGFLTEVEPLLLWTTASDRSWIQTNFTVRYVKGMARSSTLLMVLAMMQAEQVDIPALFQEFFHSINMIHVVFENHCDMASVAIANAHHSNRGSIRAPHDIMTWVMKLRLLERADGHNNPSAILERFNANATSKGKVGGNKRMSALALLQTACKNGVDLMVELLGHLGLKSVWWSEDTFCNKKLLPGFTPRTNRSSWNQILVVTEDSFNVWVASLNCQQRNKNSKARRSLDKGRLEEHALLASFWSWAVAAASSDGLPDEVLRPLHEKFIAGDVALQLDLQSLVHERKADVSWKDV